MSGITDLPTLLASLRPALGGGEFVFVTRPGASYGDGAELAPVAAFTEAEGLTLVVPRDRAEARGEPYDGVFRRITLRVHSSLAAVGLTAAVAGALTEHGISANVIAAFHHDHVFVPAERAEDALDVLTALPSQRQPGQGTS